MLGNRLTCRIKMLGKCIRRHSLQGYQSNDCPSCRICDGLENVSSHLMSSHYETEQLQVYLQLFGFASVFESFFGIKEQTISRCLTRRMWPPVLWPFLCRSDMIDASRV